MSSAIGARVSASWPGPRFSDTWSAPREEKSSFELRHCSTFTGSKMWFWSALTSSGSNGAAAARGAEGAVARGAAGAAGDLREFGRRQAAELVAVELAVGGEGDVVDVEIEAHADGVGGDEVIDVAVLEHLHLRIARARRQRAQHHGGAAMLARISSAMA